MAYIKPEEEIEQQGVNQTMGQTQNEIETPQTVSGASVSTSTPTPTAASTSTNTNSVSTTPSPTARSGIYTNLQDYMQQNQPAAQNIAGKATEKIEGQAQQIGQQVQQQQSDFMNKVAENRAKLQQAQQTAQQQIQQAGQQEFDPADIQRTQQLAQGNFQLDTPEFDVQEYQKQAEDIARMTDMGQTQQGRRELLTQAFRTPEQRYNIGQRSLDELILAGDPTARQRIAEAPKAASEALTQQITGAREQALADIAGLGTEREQIQSQVAQDIDAAQAAMRQELENRAAFGKYIDQFSQGQVTQELLDALELEGNRLYGVDPLTYLRGASSSQLATAEDLARARTLQALEGSQAGLAEAGIADASVVGNQDAFGMQALRDAVARGRSEYETELESLAKREQQIKDLDQRLINELSTGNYRSDMLRTGGIDGTRLIDAGSVAKQISDELGVSLDRGFQIANEYTNSLNKILQGGVDQEAFQGLQDMAMQEPNLRYEDAVKNEIQKQLDMYRNNPSYDRGVKGLFDKIAEQRSSLQDQYGNIITPESSTGTAQMGFFADGGTKKDPRKEALKKLMGK